MFRGMVNSEGIDVLERVMQFASERQRLINHNIANLSTPNFRPVDVSPQEFKAALAEAVDRRRERHPGQRHPLRPDDTRNIRFERDRLILSPKPTGENVLFHDRNDRDLERQMQDLAENVMVYRQASELARSRLNLLSAAIRGRI